MGFSPTLGDDFVFVGYSVCLNMGALLMIKRTMRTWCTG